MAIYNIYLDLENDYINLIKDCYKIIVVLVVFQALVHYSGAQKNILNTALTGSLLNDEFITLLFFVLIGVSAYYLVFDKLLNIN
jgi:uncharacterized membrane protein YesL